MDKQRQLIVKKSGYSGKAVVYIMSRDQRVDDNHTLLAAQKLAMQHKLPLYVLFVLSNISARSHEHYKFMLGGLSEASDSLSQCGIPFILRIGEPTQEIRKFAQETGAGTLFFDFSPLTGARSLIKQIAKDFDGSITVVDTHNIIPAWVLSDKKEFAAHTIRAKVHKKLGDFLVSPPPLQKQLFTAAPVHTASFDEAQTFIQSIPKSGIRPSIQPGAAAAQSKLQGFVKNNLETYATSRNDISNDSQSGLSPYLHFGQISSLRVALDVINSVNQVPLLLQQAKLVEHTDQPNRADGMNVLLEEMIVRKELADNFCFYSEHGYKTSKAAPEWAQKSLAEHSADARDFTYTTEQWESALTHDETWNAAQNELRKTGKMHGYMRMYWAKKILEWSASADEALTTTIYLNDKYSLDGGDPNGYVGILWSIAGLHDRPWFERPVFGKIRYMNEAGLRRKFSVDAYLERVQSI